MLQDSTGSITVLHVDDEPDFVEMAAEFVSREDHRLEVVTATNASDGLDRIREGDIHCVVSDFDMPGLDGIEFLKTVREDHPDLPFILFTGKGSEEVAGEAISKGVTDYLQKETGTSHYELLSNRIVNAVDQRRSRDAATETEQRLQTIAENSNDILWKFTADWEELLFINSAYEEVWGRSIEELAARPKSFLEGVHPDDRSLLTDAMDKLTSGDSMDIEYRVNADEDFSRWVWSQGEPVLDDGGEVDKVVGFGRDITERKAREQEIRALEAKYRSITEDVLAATGVGIFVLNPDFEVAWCNEATGDFFGIDLEGVIGRDKRQLVREEIADVLEDPDRFTERVLGTYDDNTYTEEFECHVIGGDGRADRWLGHLSHPIEMGRFEGGRVEVYTDITDRKEREQHLARQNVQLNELTGIISHDLRTPLSVAMGRLDSACKAHDSEDLEAATRALERMEPLIEEALDLAMTGVVSTDIQPVLLSDIVDNNWREREVGAATANVTMDQAICADSDQLHHLVENLISNAAEHGESPVTVTIGALPDGFYVEDDGPGIPAGERDKIFETGYSTKPEERASDCPWSNRSSMPTAGRFPSPTGPREAHGSR